MDFLDLHIEKIRDRFYLFVHAVISVRSFTGCFESEFASHGDDPIETSEQSSTIDNADTFT